MHGQQRSDPPSMGVEGQSHSPPGPSTSPPHGPTDPWTLAHTAPPTCRLRVRGPGTAQRCTRMPRACGSQDATPAPLLDAHSGTRAMARGAVSADPRGSCHQPLRYHVSPAKWLRRPILRRRTRHAVDLESTLLLSIQNALALISSLYYTHVPQLLHAPPPTRGLTHARHSLWHSLLPHHTHTSTHLNVPDLGILNPWSI